MGEIKGMSDKKILQEDITTYDIDPNEFALKIHSTFGIDLYNDEKLYKLDSLKDIIKYIYES